MHGGVAWSKGGDNLTDEVPRRSQVRDDGYAAREGHVRKVRGGGGARGVPWRSLLGDVSVSGEGLLFFRDHKDTPTREGGRAVEQGSSDPTGLNRAGSPCGLRGRPLCVRRTDAR